MATPLYRLRSRHKRLIEEYRLALEEERESGAARAFAMSTNLWHHICRQSRRRGIDVSAEMHLVVLFSLAVGAGNKAEGERIYMMMDPSARALLDEMDEKESGAVKIWGRGGGE
jgi:hypothetical protein